VPNYTFTKRNELQVRTKRPSALTTLIYITAALAIVFIFIQLYVMSIFATRGDDVAKLESQKSALVQENKKLSEEIADARKYDYIKEKSQNLGYVDINSKDVNYLTIEQ
jgi:cell division protein FtsL